MTKTIKGFIKTFKKHELGKEYTKNIFVGTNMVIGN